MPKNSDVERLRQELAAAPTRADAAAIFETAAWIFVDMHPNRRERLYAQMQDIVNEKPH